VEAHKVVRGWGSHIFRHSAHRWRQGCQPYAPAAFYPQENSWYSVRDWVDPRAIVQLEGLGKLKKSTSYGTWTGDLPACGTVPQPTTLPRALFCLCSSLNVRDQVSHSYRTTGKIVLYILTFTFLDSRRATLLIKKLPTHSRAQVLSEKLTAAQLVKNLKVHYHAHRSPSFTPIMNYMNPVSTLKSHSFNVCLQIIVQLTLRSTTWSATLMLLQLEHSVRIFQLSESCYMSRPTHLPSCRHPNNILWVTNYSITFLTQISPPLCYRPFLRSSTLPRFLSC
jgi:hypothetical protein